MNFRSMVPVEEAMLFVAVLCYVMGSCHRTVLYVCKGDLKTSDLYGEMGRIKKEQCDTLTVE